MAKFNNTITNPFASGGDKMTIPDTTTDGSINYSQGFSNKYGLPIEDGGLYIPRGGINALFYQSQAAIQELQQKVPLSVNGVFPAADGNIALANLNITSLTTNADGIYLRHEGKSLTWGNSDFSSVYGAIGSDTSGLKINSTYTDIVSSYNETVLTIKAENFPNIRFKNELVPHIGVVAMQKDMNFVMGWLSGTIDNYLSLQQDGGVLLRAVGGVGINTAPDSAYALKVGGDTKIAGSLYCNVNISATGRLYVGGTAQFAGYTEFIGQTASMLGYYGSVFNGGPFKQPIAGVGHIGFTRNAPKAGGGSYTGIYFEIDKSYYGVSTVPLL